MKDDDEHQSEIIIEDLNPDDWQEPELEEYYPEGIEGYYNQEEQ